MLNNFQAGKLQRLRAKNQAGGLGNKAMARLQSLRQQNQAAAPEMAPPLTSAIQRQPRELSPEILGGTPSQPLEGAFSPEQLAQDSQNRQMQLTQAQQQNPGFQPPPLQRPAPMQPQQQPGLGLGRGMGQFQQQQRDAGLRPSGLRQQAQMKARQQGQGLMGLGSVMRNYRRGGAGGSY